MNIFYFHYLNDIGGVESFFYYIAKKYHKYDITIYYSHGSIKQVERLRKYVRVKKYKGERIKCKKAFWNYQPEIINNVDAKEHIGIIHANYMKQPELWQPNKKITRYIAVSKDCAKAFTELTGIPCEYAYIPIEYDFTRQRLLITAAQRMASMKGENRIIELDKELTRQEIPHLILVFTNQEKEVTSDNIVFVPSRLDIANYIKGSDYFLCLSDYESYGLAPVEALCVGVPIIKTPLKVFDELGIDDKNSITLNFDCSNITSVVKKMVTKKFKFKYTPKEDRWDEILDKSKSTYEKDKKKKVKTICKRGYFDLVEQKDIEKDAERLIKRERAEYLEGLGLVEIEGD